MTGERHRLQPTEPLVSFSYRAYVKTMSFVGGHFEFPVRNKYIKHCIGPFNEDSCQDCCE
jgi:hypothetical protein